MSGRELRAQLIFPNDECRSAFMANNGFKQMEGFVNVFENGDGVRCIRGPLKFRDVLHEHALYIWGPKPANIRLAA